MANKWTCWPSNGIYKYGAKKRTGPRTRQPRHDISKTDSKQPMWLWKQHLHVCFMIHRKGIKMYLSCRISNYVKCTRGCPQNTYVPPAFVLRTSPLVLSSNSSFSKHRCAFPSSLFPGAGAVKRVTHFLFGYRIVCIVWGHRNEWATAGSLSLKGRKIRLLGHITSANNPS